MKKDKRNSKEMDDVDSLIEAMNYELAGEVGVISPEGINRNKDIPESAKNKKDSNSKKRK